MIWYHYTCSHGHAGITKTGRLLSTVDLVEQAGGKARMSAEVRRTAELIWLTDLAEPMRDALGLTSHEVSCDRTKYRWRVVDLTPTRYVDMRRSLPAPLRRDLESAPGALPMHWWVAQPPVPVVFDPIGGVP